MLLKAWSIKNNVYHIRAVSCAGVCVTADLVAQTRENAQQTLVAMDDRKVRLVAR